MMARFSGQVICLLSGLLLILTAGAVRAQGGRGIRSVDFRNFTYRLDERSVRLRNGKYESPEKSPQGGAIVGGRLVDIQYVDFDGDGQEEAAVQIHVEVNGSAGSIEGYYVFAYRDGAPRQIFRELHSGGKRMRVVGRSIVITAPFWREGDADCCPSAEATDTYAWRGSRLVRVSHRLRPAR